jgi:hypothetical protein
MRDRRLSLMRRYNVLARTIYISEISLDRAAMVRYSRLKTILEKCWLAKSFQKLDFKT